MYRFEVELALGNPQEVDKNTFGDRSKSFYIYYRESDTCSECISFYFIKDFLWQKVINVTVFAEYTTEEAAKEAFLSYSAAVQAEYQGKDGYVCTTETIDGREILTAGVDDGATGIRCELELCGTELLMQCDDIR